MSRFPFGIPNSWYLVAYSEDLAPGQLESLRYFERDLVLYRGESGQVGVLDAHCPHLGAHLGFGGCVVGDSLSCPFHGWRWEADGRCSEIPYAKRIPADISMRSYPVVERNGMILVWYHATDEPPSFEIPEIAEWGASDWLQTWLVSDWTVKSHPQDLAENGVDWAHFSVVHGIEAPKDLLCEFFPNTYTFRIGGSKPVSTLGGRTDELVMHGENWGMGYSWLHQFGTHETIVATGMTPIDGETTHVRMGVIARVGDRPAEAVRDEIQLYMKEHTVFAEQDFPIWENKVYVERPGYWEEDGPIAEYRRWTTQFY